MAKVWVVVADGCFAKIFFAETNTKLALFRTLDHPESRMANHELVSDRPGRGTELKAGAPHMLQKELAPKQREKDHFAEELADFLETSFNSGEFEKCYLICSTSLCSLMHHHLKPAVKKAIAQEIHKDLTAMKAEEIREYLPPVL